MSGKEQDETSIAFPPVYIISDSVGLTGSAIARAAAVQFGIENPRIEICAKVTSFDEIRSFFEQHIEDDLKTTNCTSVVVFYTLVSAVLAGELRSYVLQHPEIVALDIMTPALDALAKVSGRIPLRAPGKLHVANQQYFSRIEAVEFAIAHDDGRNPQDLTHADMVLLGVSRSSKTPLSIYLSQQGYKVANVPLDMQTEPPSELFEVDPARIFGLMTSPDLLVSIRRKRLGNAAGVAQQYADPNYVYDDLEKARNCMRRLGCIVIHTEGRAVEETAQEILTYYLAAFPYHFQ